MDAYVLLSLLICVAYVLREGPMVLICVGFLLLMGLVDLLLWMGR